MKKLLLLLGLVFICSCSSDDLFDTSNDYQTTISPPSWIRGTWIEEKGKIIEFTKSDIIVDPNGNRYSANGEITYYLIKDEDPEIVEIQTDSTYTLQFNESASSRKNLKFIKISDTQIESKGSYKGIYTKK